MSNQAIEAEGLGKRFRIGVKEKMPDTLVSAFSSWMRSPMANYRRLANLTRFRDNEDGDDVLWALRDVSFSVTRGEVIGFIGRNGAGKSTLLKILSRITDPTTGQVEIFGRVSSLLEVGTGFHQELTGRENIYLNGTILGMKKREIDRKFDEIVQFSGVESFLDTPVKRYSSGMTVRLAFAVAANLEPEILIVDEVLAVGDVGFQQKSIGKMQDVARDEGRTVLFVSHNMAAIENLCQRVILMERGRIVTITDTRTAIREYLKMNNQIKTQDLSGLRRRGSGKIVLTSFALTDETDHTIEFSQSGRTVVLCAKYRSSDIAVSSKIDVCFSIMTVMGERLINLFSSDSSTDFALLPEEGEFRCRIPSLPLKPGRYLIEAAVWVDNVEADHPVEPIGSIDVEPGDFFGTGRLPAMNRASILVAADWSLQPSRQLSESIS